MNEKSCIFCRIVSGEAKSSQLFQDDQVTAFHDNHPLAATHVLIVPNKHIDSVNAIEPGDAPLLGYMLVVARDLAARLGVAESGYRLIFNTGPDGGQTIYHLHLHLIAGKIARFSIG
jgi:histidine triad (HIT) family protein